MKRIFSSLLFAGLMLVLGAAAFLAFPGGGLEVAQPDPLLDAGAAPAAQTQAVTASSKYNTIAQVLDNGIINASGVKADIEANSGVTVSQVLKYDPGVGYSVYDPTDFLSVDFAVTTGLPMFILVSGPGTDTYTLVGDVPPAGSVNFSLTGSGTPSSCTYNFISLPLDQGGISNASGLVSAIGDVSQVLEYNPDTGFSVYDPTDFLSIDFPLNIGYPYFVCMTASKNWPTP